MPASMSGRTAGSPKARSKMQLEHTMGTCVGPTGRPMPRLSSSRATPLAASRPKADPPKGRRRGPCPQCSRDAVGRSRAMPGHRRERQHRRWRLGCHDYGATGAGLLVRVVAKAKAIDIANVNGLKQCIHVLLLSVFRRALCPVGIRTVRRNCRRWGIPSARCNYDSF